MARYVMIDACFDSERLGKMWRTMFCVVADEAYYGIIAPRQEARATARFERNNALRLLQSRPGHKQTFFNAFKSMNSIYFAPRGLPTLSVVLVPAHG